MKSVGCGWVVLLLPTKALCCLSGLVDFHYCSAQLKHLHSIQALTREAVFCYVIQRSSADTRCLCGPALALLCWLALLLLCFFQH